MVLRSPLLHERLACLFEVFSQVDDSSTREYEGTGLGLALVAKIVDDHQGAIEYDTVPGRTEFRILLPLPTVSESL